MTEREMLLRSILTEPDDDTARLVFADWLDENGELLLAAFIRTQCEYETWRPNELCVHNSKPHYRFKPSKQCGAYRDRPLTHNCPCRGEVLRTRERALWASFVGAAHDGDGLLWGLSVQRCTVPMKHAPRRYTEETYVVARGFVSEIHLPTATFLEHAASIFAAHPVTKVTLWDMRPSPITTDDDRPEWTYFIGTINTGYHLPQDIYYRLKGQWRHSRDAAIEALSPACVEWARSLVGLPPLPTRTTGAA